MPELTIKYKSLKTLKALQELSKTLDIIIELPHAAANKSTNLPITFAKYPDVKALAGIWQEKDITLEDLRKEAWGNRL